MTVALVAAFLAALLAPIVSRATGRSSGRWLAIFPFGLLLSFVAMAGPVVDGRVVRETTAWAPSLGADFSFVLDGLSLLFAVLISGIGGLVVVYSGAYLADDPARGRFHLTLLLFMASMLGLVLADNLIVLFVFWELTSITSYFLIGFDHDRPQARAAALQALLVTGGGGLALLAGLVLLGLAGGSFELSALAAGHVDIRSHALYLPILLLVLAGAFTKSAQFPFHFWLPAAMEAPTPVSAYLHSATMVKAGIYLIARLTPTLGGTESWFVLVTAFGAVTMVTGGVVALFQHDLKRVLAFSTVSALGALTMMLGMGSRMAVEAAIVFLVAHALYKGALFLVAGSIDHETGTRDLRALSGLGRAMPVTTAAALLGAVSLAGFGPVMSFIGKERLLEAVIEAERGRALLMVPTLVAAVCYAAVACMTVRPFFGVVRATPRHPHEAPAAMWAGPVVLAALGVALGLEPFGAAETVVAWAGAAIVGGHEPVHLTLWHGLTFPLALSALSIGAGVGLYLMLPRLRRGLAPATRWTAIDPAWWYAVAFDGLNAAARAQTRVLQNGRLRFYLTTVLVTALVLATPALLEQGVIAWRAPAGWPGITDAVLSALIVAAALAAARSSSRLGAVTSLGVAGVGIALIYVMYGAPDLAITQILVETLTVILFVLVFYRLPRFAALSSTAARARDATLALGIGALMTTLLIASTSTSRAPAVAEALAARSVPDGHGRNVVNVILVDVRGLDTLGEITVLALAGIGVYALLRLRPENGG